MKRLITVAAAQLGAIQRADTRESIIQRMVALMEIRLMVARFLERTRTITLNGPNERTASTVSVGFKSLPVRFEMA